MIATKLVEVKRAEPGSAAEGELSERTWRVVERCAAGGPEEQPVAIGERHHGRHLAAELAELRGLVGRVDQPAEAGYGGNTATRHHPVVLSVVDPAQSSGLFATGERRKEWVADPDRRLGPGQVVPQPKLAHLAQRHPDPYLGDRVAWVDLRFNASGIGEQRIELQEHVVARRVLDVAVVAALALRERLRHGTGPATAAEIVVRPPLIDT